MASDDITIQNSPPNAWALLDILGQGDAQKAREFVDEGMKVAEAFLLQRQISAPAQRFLDEFQQALTKLSLDELFDLLPGKSHQRTLAFSGMYRPPTGYHINLQPLTQPATSIGNVDGRITATQTNDLAIPALGEKGDGYLFEGQMSLGLGAMTYQQGLQFLDQGWDFLEESAAFMVDKTKATVLKGRYPAITSPADQSLLASLDRNFPETMSHLDGLVDIRQISSQASPLTLDITAYPNLNKIAPAYPALAEYLTRLDDLFDVKAEFVDGKGRVVLALHLQSQSENGKPKLHIRYGQHPLDFTNLKSTDFKLRLTGRYHVWGIEVDIDELVLDGAYQANANRAQMRYVLNKIPVITVSGSNMFTGAMVAVGKLTRLVDPDKESLRFFNALALGKGAGKTHMTLTYDKKAPDQNLVTGRFQIPLLDNWVMQKGLEIFSQELKANQDAAVEMDTILQKLFLAFKADYQRGKP